MDPPPLPDPVVEDASASGPAAAVVPSGGRYFAIRSGKSDVSNAIFVRWSDAEPHIRDDAQAVYQAFDTLQDAAAYLGDEDATATAAASSGSKRKRPKSTEARAQTKTTKRSKKSSKKTKGNKKKGSAAAALEPSDKWTAMYDRLKQYHDTNGGSTNIHPSDEANTDLRKWLINQRSQLNGVLTKCAEESTDLPPQVEEKVALFTDLGIDVQAKGRSAQYLAKFDVMFDELKAFKEENGHVLVPTEKPEYTQLANWVYTQQKEYRLYKKEKEGGTDDDNNEGSTENTKKGKKSKSRLTDDLVLRLHEIGFVFERREKFLTWEERMEQLRQFKEENGHCKVKTNDPELGQWVSKMRREYREYTEGTRKNLRISASTMDKRIADLTELGFVFAAGKRITLPPKHKQKTWDQRFQELMEYREKEGHCVVPQSFPGLGEWVHRQRKDYKNLRDGKKSSMTAERSIKLAEAGFVFDTRNQKLSAEGREAVVAAVAAGRSFPSHFAPPAGPAATSASASGDIVQPYGAI